MKKLRGNRLDTTQNKVAYYDIVVENGSYKLVLINDTLVDDTAITAIPYQ